MSLNELLLIWLIPAGLFLGVSFMVRRSMLLPAMALNVAFLSFGYFAEAQLLSNAKPIYQKIPFYTHGVWGGEGVKILYSVAKEENQIYVLVEENNIPKLYQLPFNPTLQDQLKRAGKGKSRLKDTDHTFYGAMQPSLSVENLPERPYEPKIDPSTGEVQNFD